ncbi:MAG: phosphatase PAP2 family protein [bacterium]
MKKLSLSILLAFFFQILSQNLWAYSRDLSFEGVSDFEVASSDKEVPKSEKKAKDKPSKDEEFSARSQKASKFVFSDLPRHLGLDLKESFWGWGSFALALGLAATAGVHYEDDNFQKDFTPHKILGNTGDKIVNQLGAPYTMAGVGVLTTVIGVGLHNEKLWTTGESAIEALFWTELFTIGLQYGVNRTRPDGSSHGFPSAHASGVFSTAAVFEVMYGPKVGAPLFAFASLVALARVDSFKHFPSDVVMGAALGTVIGYGTAKFHKHLHNSFSLTPDVGPDRYGMVLYHAF